jgi:hypothetical protein
MNDYTKGILTGASLILCFFMFVSAKSQSKNLGDITVNSLQVVDENGSVVGLLSSSNNRGTLSLAKAGEKPSVMIYCQDYGGVVFTHNTSNYITGLLGTDEDGRGVLSINNSNSKPLAIFAADGKSFGLSTYTTDGKKTAFLGTDDGSGLLSVSINGIIETLNADGKLAAYFGTAEGGGGVFNTFNAKGIQTAFIGTSKTGGGFLRTLNKNEVQTGYFGTNNQNDGIAVLFDRYGNDGWGASGKK